MTGEVFFAICVAMSLTLLAAAAALTIWRIAIGPTVADRLLGLYMLMLALGGSLAVVGASTGVAAQVDLLFVLGVLALLLMVAGTRAGGPASGAAADDEESGQS